ncbi:hypothetical protein NDK50_35090 [Paraburkholderia bryophila]|uniref:hypothetical protein n=1 Tax=Paraburkholderia bryophila TaxID=420952 RepID=UPI002349E01C|nr:hypothetical protein [Paraburkholderia bryophila]WCM23178.1 hypothetical protein NDK50_35090 [Paraburkholderia bryophila]
MVAIYREGGAVRLVADELANELMSDGFVAFTSTRTRQRALARAIERLVAEDLSMVGVETDSPNECMCVIDVGRYSIQEVRAMVTVADVEYENERFPDG